MPSASTQSYTAEQLQQGLLAGERAMLAKAITIAESTLDSDRQATETLLKNVLQQTGNSIRIGITGVPGVGKSTFIESFGTLLTAQGKKVAVLAIDPSSQKTKGSILGDKTRMEQLSRNPNVFIRPSPSSQALGGVSFHTRETVLLCEAAGFDIILIETVGVGQSETYVRSMVDFFLLLILAGAGDELQGIKKGIMEMADGIIVNKADGENVKASAQAKVDAQNALHFQEGTASGWTPSVMTISSLGNKGIDEVWNMIQAYHQQTAASGYFSKNRSDQNKQWLEESIEYNFRKFLNNPAMMSRKEQLLNDITHQSTLPSEAARLFLNSILPK